MDMPETKTVDIKENKEIDIYTFGADKVRISVLLSIAGNGNKLPPILVFKAKKNGRFENDLNSLQIVKDKKIFVYCQGNAWCDTDIFLNWLKNIYLNYELIKIKKKCLLILDKAPSHCTNTIIDFLNNNKIKRVFIPGGLTRKLQPLDLSVNKPLKEKLKKKYNQYIIDKGDEDNTLFHNHQAKVDRKLIVQWVHEIWENDINSDIIVNGFKKSGITAKDDGSEDDMANIENEDIDLIIDSYEKGNSLNEDDYDSDYESDEIK